ncbi:hypothetical protein WMF26_06905 [Sorangium sp. So ce185]|uniref:hypothetical protein n=1 Tax=Sorangium sp. So ce185 TaxID=3133287 RepID=UPI003F6386FE
MRALANVLLTQDPPRDDATINERSWLLSSISTFADHQVLAFFEDGDSSASNLGSHFSRVSPKSDGTFDLELGAVLPDWLPNIEDDRAEYTLEVRAGDGNLYEICVSNQMGRMSYLREEKQYHILFPRHKLWRAYAADFAKVPADAPEVATRSVATARFSIEGINAVEALENHVKRCQRTLIECLNNIATSVVALTRASFPTLLAPIYDESTFDAFYLLLRGERTDLITSWRVVSSLRQAMRRPSMRFDADTASRMRASLKEAGKLDDLTRVIHMARCYAEGGLLEFALLQLVIAAEVATDRFVAQMRGKTKRSSGAGFATLLNVELPRLCPTSMKPDAVLIGRLDLARQQRNKVMHEAVFAASREYIRALHDDVQAFVEHLNGVLTHLGHRRLTAGSAAQTNFARSEAM